MPASCNETISAKKCEFRLSIGYPYIYRSITLTADSSKNFVKNSYYVNIQLSDDGDVSYSYSFTHQCKNKDECAREFIMNKLSDILNRQSIDFHALRKELFPLLSSTVSIETADLLCFNSKENVRQCAITNKPGACHASQLLTHGKKISYSCDNEYAALFRNEPYVSILDSDNLAMFIVACNRSLCNGPMTFQAVKQILFNYNITKTIDGRLNNGLRLTFSFTFLMLIIIFILCI